MYYKLGNKALTYVAAPLECIDEENNLLLDFAEQMGLDVLDQYADDGHIGEALVTMFRRVCTEEVEGGWTIVVPTVQEFGPDRMRRALLAAFRELGVPILEAKSQMAITWLNDPRAGRILNIAKGERTAAMQALGARNT